MLSLFQLTISIVVVIAIIFALTCFNTYNMYHNKVRYEKYHKSINITITFLILVLMILVFIMILTKYKEIKHYDERQKEFNDQHEKMGKMEIERSKLYHKIADGNNEIDRLKNDLSVITFAFHSRLPEKEREVDELKVELNKLQKAFDQLSINHGEALKDIYDDDVEPESKPQTLNKVVYAEDAS